MTTMRTLESGVSGGAIWRGGRQGCGGERHGQDGGRALPPLCRRIGPPARPPGLFGWFSQAERHPCRGCWRRGVPGGQSYLDRGTRKPGELLDVLALLADDGTDRLRGDEDVHGLLLRRLRVPGHHSGYGVAVQGSVPPAGQGPQAPPPGDAHTSPKGTGLSQPQTPHGLSTFSTAFAMV